LERYKEQTVFKNDNFLYQYAPILTIRNSEMTALNALPEKEKDILLPIISLRGWVSSKKLENSTKRVNQAIGDRWWIADIDSDFLIDGHEKRLPNGDYPREVFKEIEDLLKPDNGYFNWVQYIRDNPNIIPTVQLEDTSQIRRQLVQFSQLGRGIVFRFDDEDIKADKHEFALTMASDLGLKDIFVVYDYGQVSREILNYTSGISALVKWTDNVLDNPLIAISCTSFPFSFSGYSSGEYSIYERLLFNKVLTECSDSRLIYSDWGSARAERIDGGGGIPSPRIDYPLKNEWRCIRKEFQDFTNPQEGEKDELYKEVAIELMSQKYWNPLLRVWGTQMIELTSLGDAYGIDTASKATAVRINMHLHQQLYYNSPEDLTDTDEDWVD
jgi:hypothetical protein